MPIDKGFEPYLPTPSLFSQISLLYLMPMCYHYLKWTPLGIKMTDRKPRINVTVDDDMNELIAELAALQGIPKATLITQYLDMLRPHMVEIRDAIKMVNDKKDPSPQLRKMLLDGQQQLFDVIKEEFTDD